MAIEGMHIEYPRGESQTVRALVRNADEQGIVAGRYIRVSIPGLRDAKSMRLRDALALFRACFPCASVRIILTMIPLEALRAVKRCVVHANCADGRASAIILHAALPDAEIVEVCHNSAGHKAIEPTEGLLFCDMVPWIDLGKPSIAEWVDSGAIVLDHHEGTRDVVSAFGERGVFGDNDRCESGAWLAFEEVLRVARSTPVSVLDYWSLSKLAAIRDTWQRTSPDWHNACRLSEVLRFLPLDECLSRDAENILLLANDIGRVLWSKKQKAAEKAAANAVRVTVAGQRVAIVPTRALAEDVCDLLGDVVDIVAGFDYHHDDGGVFLKWSLRSHAGVDVSAIARTNGGNGHAAAAGFGVPVVLSSTGPKCGQCENPYDIIANILSRS